MYKIYINETPLYLLSDPTSVFPVSDEKSGANHLVLKYTKKKKILLNVINQLESSKRFDTVVIYHSDVEDLWKDFTSLFKCLEAAGGLVLNDENKALVIFRRGFWDLPKGKIDNGESPEMAALREVTEEVGLNKIAIKSALPPTYHTYSLKGQRILKKTWWYEMSTSDTDLVLQHEEDIEKGEWAERTQVNKKLESFYGSIRDVLASCQSF